MKRFKLIFNILFIILLATNAAYAQPYRSPLNIPAQLSGNFGELRNNHFHSGIDYKTKQVENQPVFSIGDGYVSRINVSPSGYGLALYIDHPSGHTSVYGHLNSFSKPIADYVKQKQYEEESFRIDIYLKPNEIPVKKGEQIALSGNTGSSGGPHLHFEVRDTQTQNPLDPLQLFGKTVVDTERPDIRGIAFYPVEGKGVVNGSNNPLRLSVAKNKSGVPQALSQTIHAWGKIGIGVKAYDRMNGQHNIYGVKRIRLFVDEKPVFRSEIDKFSFNKTRMLNTFIDFEDWRERNSFYMKSFIDAGNTLHFYDAADSGFITINEERNYRLQYELQDFHGNTLTYSFVVKGEQQPIEPIKSCENFMPWMLYNSIVDYDFLLNIPQGNLYNNICFTHSRTSSFKYHSDIHQINNQPVPLHNEGALWLKISADTLQNKQQYGVITISKNGKEGWIRGSYKNGGVEIPIRELGGKYAVDIDTIPPQISPVNQEKWAANKKIRIRLTDNKSGIAKFRGTIDDKFALFSHDMKSDIYTYVPDDSRLERNKTHVLRFTATDAAGNREERTYIFDY